MMPQTVHAADQPLLSVRNLITRFDTPAGVFNAVDGISFSIYPGQTLALVGESGCGKSVTALSLMRLITEPGRIVGGQVIMENRDLLSITESQMRRVRGGKIAMIFQDPMTSLNPVYTVGNQICEPLKLHRNMKGK